jgi:3-methyladenine DNA glycosylase AlkD
LSKQIGRDHRLAQELSASGVLEARLLAALVDEPGLVTEAKMARWARGFDSWAVCDACCVYLFDRTRFAPRKAVQWIRRREELVKRAGFALMAALAVHDKEAPDALFLRFSASCAGAADERHLLRKGASWALRQIGKRNRALNRAALRTAAQLMRSGSPAARWVAADARRDLVRTGVQDRVPAPSRRASGLR